MNQDPRAGCSPSSTAVSERTPLLSSPATHRIPRELRGSPDVDDTHRQDVAPWWQRIPSQPAKNLHDAEGKLHESGCHGNFTAQKLPTPTTTPTPQQQQQQQPHQDQGQDQQQVERTIIVGPIPLRKVALILSTAWLGVSLGAMDSTIMATLSAPIASDFKSLSLLSWLATSYLIASATCPPISGRLTDVFGRGPGLVFSNLVFAAGNLICGLAREKYAMILGRAVAGIGGGGLMSIAAFLASDLVPLRQRGLLQGINNVCYASGAMMGGIAGGLLNDHFVWGWRLAFLVQVPPALLSAVAVAILVRVPPKQSSNSYLSRIDFAGVILTALFLVLLFLGLNSGGNIVPWTHPLPLITIPLSLVALVALIWRECKARHPIIPVRLLLKPTVSAACGSNLFCSMSIMATLFYVPLYLQALGDSASNVGLKMLIGPVGASMASVGSGYLMKGTGRYYGLAVSSILVLILGNLGFTLQNKDTPLGMASAAWFLVGIGQGGMLTTTLLASIAAVDHSQQAVVTAAIYLARSLGSTVGVTVASVVYQNLLKTRLWFRFGQRPGAADEIDRIRNDLDELKHLPAGWHKGVMESFMEAFRGVWLTMLVLAVASLVCISMMRQHTLYTTLERR